MRSIDVNIENVDYNRRQHNPSALPQIYQQRNVVSHQITPKNQLQNKLNEKVQIHRNQNNILPRARSKDSINLVNNLRDQYKGNVQNVVEMGRIESQRLLLENYQRLDHNRQALYQPNSNNKRGSLN